MFLSAAKESSDTELYRPIISNEILNIATRCPIETSRAKGTKEQKDKLVAHELVLHEEGEDEVVMGTVRVPIATSMDIREVSAKRLETQEETSIRINGANESRPVDTKNPPIDIGGSQKVGPGCIAS